MKIDFDKAGTWLVLFFAFLIVFCLVLFKILGASEFPKQFVEKDGYCELEFGDDWNYDDKTSVCQRGFDLQPFLIDNFEVVCPDQKILSRGFYSECFKLGRGG